MKPGGRLAHLRFPPWLREILLVLGVFAVYDLTRGLSRGSIAAAVDRGNAILHGERVLHLAPEQWLDGELHQLTPLAVGAAYYYSTLHFVVTPAVLVWLYRSHRPHYASARTWLAIASLVALLGFCLLPVAPPRLLPGAGIHDVVAEVHRWGWWSDNSAAPRGLAGLTNEYAAMPSLHAGWALWCGWLMLRHARHRAVRIAGVLYPVVTTLVILGTGNHYLLDAVVGLALVALVGAGNGLVRRRVAAARAATGPVRFATRRCHAVRPVAGRATRAPAHPRVHRAEL
ncbi:PAP2 superfamily protein [Jatrophihabitans endophyticus]|uniref:PAP2 superfamily protein n=1 Tax=Jatrophihabitans endophyticus TaxID=1206085 RepID=A0A1M5DRN6_9ACTN|nr:phosphatase PAP2 family protein [Jatrophihabitans endophyticus]SHF69643.1 PAP2 superfamily protein [Jatrophihabitans endophyticus]